MNTLPFEIQEHICLFLDAKSIDLYSKVVNKNFTYVLKRRYRIEGGVSDFDVLSYALSFENKACIICYYKGKSLKFQELSGTFMCQSCVSRSSYNYFGFTAKTQAKKDYYLKDGDFSNLSCISKKLIYGNYACYYANKDLRKISKLHLKKKPTKEKSVIASERQYKVNKIVKEVSLKPFMKAIFDNYVLTGQCFAECKDVFKIYKYISDTSKRNLQDEVFKKLVSTAYIKQYSNEKIDALLKRDVTYYANATHFQKDYYYAFILYGISFFDKTGLNMTHKDRRNLLKTVLNKCFSLPIRDDSVLCELYVEQGILDIDYVIDTVVEMDWLYNKTNYRQYMYEEDYFKRKLESTREKIKKMVFLEEDNPPTSMNRYACKKKILEFL